MTSTVTPAGGASVLSTRNGVPNTGYGPLKSVVGVPMAMPTFGSPTGSAEYVRSHTTSAVAGSTAVMVNSVPPGTGNATRPYDSET
jgi:hypothetical protein